MAEASSSEASSGAASTRQTRRAEGGEGGSELQTSRGQTTIDDVVVTKVAGVAAREVRGVHNLGGGVSRAVGAVTQRVGVGDERTQGVSVEVGEREAAVDLTVVIDYGESIPQVSQAIRDNIIKRIEGICGLNVTEVNVSVNDLFFPGDEEPDQPARVS
jgi:uncharacterized alkaline shock family protein YloU